MSQINMNLRRVTHTLNEQKEDIRERKGGCKGKRER
jgi:hypothetical protein